MIEKSIYLIAGERNCSRGAIEENGGLYANVGETTRSIVERVRDLDYKRKQLGGRITCLKQWKLPSSRYNLSDKDIHKQLKMHPRIKWEASDNTEEFLFLDDKGDGSVAIETIENVIIGMMCPSFVIDKLCKLKQDADFSHDNERQKLVDERKQLELDKLSHKECQEIHTQEKIKNLLSVNKRHVLTHRAYKKDKEENIALLNRRIERFEFRNGWYQIKIDTAESSLSKVQTAFAILSMVTIVTTIIFYFMYGNQSSLVSEKEEEMESLKTSLLEKEDVIKLQLEMLGYRDSESTLAHLEFARCAIDPKSITEKDRQNASSFLRIYNNPCEHYPTVEECPFPQSWTHNYAK